MSAQVLDALAGLSTSAAGPMATAASRRAVWLSGPWVQSTAAGGPSPEAWLRAARDLRLSTTCAFITEVPAATPSDARAALVELRHLSGLTWEQLAQVLGVSRRTLHFWASGKPLKAPNEEHLRRLLAVLRRVDRGAADLNRAVLLTERDGTIPIQLLEERRYDEFLHRVGEGRGRRALARQPLSEEARQARRPQPPGELVDVSQDRVHRDVGRGRAARTPRSRPRGPER